MKNVVEVMQYVFAAMGGALGAVMGGWDGFLYALIVFVVMDYFTGILAAIYQKKLSSEVGFHGTAKLYELSHNLQIPKNRIKGVNAVDVNNIQEGALVWGTRLSERQQHRSSRRRDK